MSYIEGHELDCRVCVFVDWPVDVSTFKYDANDTGIEHAAWPTPPEDALAYWCPFLPYLLWQELPPGYPAVYCGVTIPHLSGNLSQARAAANLAGYQYGSSESAVDICNHILEMTQ